MLKVKMSPVDPKVTGGSSLSLFSWNQETLAWPPAAENPEDWGRGVMLSWGIFCLSDWPWWAAGSKKTWERSSIMYAPPLSPILLTAELSGGTGASRTAASDRAEGRRPASSLPNPP